MNAAEWIKSWGVVCIGGLCLAVGAAEYHVAKTGMDFNDGSKEKPFLTIGKAAEIAQPGDTITVHEGIYREWVNPPRGGASDAERVIYQAAPGERVAIKGSEIVKGWERVDGDIWMVVLPNTFFGEFNPFDDLINGDWFNSQGREHHTGAVYLNGHWLTEAGKKEELFNPEPFSSDNPGYLFNVAWLRMKGEADIHVPAASMSGHQEVQKAPCAEGGECIGYIEHGEWASYDVDFGKGIESMEFRVASETKGGRIEIRLDSPQGELLADCDVPATGGWQRWRTVKTTIVPTYGRKNLYLVFKATKRKLTGSALWFAEVDGQNTTIQAQFKGVDPNEEMVEVNVRQSVFYPEKPGRNYITVKGFVMEQAATPWAPPTAEQIGLIGTHWSKGWIIEGNVIRYSTCVGITLGKHGDEYDNTSQNSAKGYVETINRAYESHGWSKENIGSHVVRNNHISHCEQAGIVGSLGAVFSTVTGNMIHDIHTRRLFGGAEMAGIKFHAAIDSVISNNHIYNVGAWGGGIWLDWMTQGTRVTGNLMHDNTAVDLFLEVNHGPYLIDHNICLSPRFLRDWSQGGAFVHNLAAGAIEVKPQGRETPYHLAHSTEVAGLSHIAGGDNRFVHNVFLNGNKLEVYGPFSDSVIMDGNLFLDSTASLKEVDGNLFLEMPYVSLSDEQQRELVTTAVLGKARIPNLPFVDAAGQPYQFDTDYFGEDRNVKTLTPGPFKGPDRAQNTLKVWPKQIDSGLTRNDMFPALGAFQWLGKSSYCKNGHVGFRLIRCAEMASALIQDEMKGLEGAF